MIHYHGTPLFPDRDFVKAFAGRHAMVSYQTPDQVQIAAEVCQSIALDNGAFSAWRAGVTPDWHGFWEWAAHWLRHPAVDWVLIPDVIDGTEEDNDQLLRECPIRAAFSVPVWHLHEPLGRLASLVSAYPRVAFGSSGEYSQIGTPRWWSRMADAMRVACDAEGMPLAKLHGLRMLDPVVFSHCPFSSADSTNAARNAGNAARWDTPYSPPSKATRASIIMERIEAHAAAHRWNAAGAGVQQNMDLLG